MITTGTQDKDQDSGQAVIEGTVAISLVITTLLLLFKFFNTYVHLIAAEEQIVRALQESPLVEVPRRWESSREEREGGYSVEIILEEEEALWGGVKRKEDFDWWTTEKEDSP